MNSELFLKTFEQFLAQHKVWLDFVTAIGAMIFGAWQLSINSRLKSVQDFISIAAIPHQDKIKLLNTGKINLYLWGFDLPNREIRFK